MPHRWFILGLILLACAVIWLRRRACRDLLRAYFLSPGDPVDLACFRIVVFGLFFYMPPATAAAARSPRGLMADLPGWSTVADWLPWDPTFANVAAIAFMVLCGCAVIGFKTRWVTAGAALVGVYVYGLPQLVGKHAHFHHLIWFAALLAASPCGDALSVDARRRRRRGAPTPGRAVAYATPLRMAWLLMGVIYLFPGLWKIWRCGLAWASPDNMMHLMYHRWHALPEWAFRVRLDHWPWLCGVGGVLVLLFELSFIFFVIPARTRPYAALAGATFHLVNTLVIRIAFVLLWACYLGFLPWRRLLRRWVGPAPPVATRPPSARPAAIVGVLLLAINGACGVLDVDTWPFAVYPKFAYQPGPWKEVLVIEVLDADGSPMAVDEEKIAIHMGIERWGGTQRRIVRTRDPDAQRAMLRDLWDYMARVEPGLRQATRVRMWSAKAWVAPERRRDPPERARLLLEMTY